MNASAGTDIGGKPQRFRRWWVWGPVLLLSLLAGAWLGVRHSDTGKQAGVAAGYVAHVVCSCRFVGNRDMASCQTDFEPGMEIVTVIENAEKRSITASVPLLAKRTATFDPEYGCTLDKP